MQRIAFNMKLSQVGYTVCTRKSAEVQINKCQTSSQKVQWTYDSTTAGCRATMAETSSHHTPLLAESRGLRVFKGPAERNITQDRDDTDGLQPARITPC